MSLANLGITAFENWRVEKIRKARTLMQTSSEILKTQEDPGSTIENGNNEWEECSLTRVDMSIPWATVPEQRRGDKSPVIEEPPEK